MDEKELQEFSLEDIMKEFGSDPEEETPEVVPEEEIPEDAPEKTTYEGAQPLNEVSQDTIRLDQIPVTQGKVRNAQIIEDEPEEEPVMLPVEEEKTEPYSEEWEPEYEQPIAEYVPQAPIIFRPQSRLRELKRQLVAGPEKLYYAMSEKGFGKLQAAIFCSVVVVFLSALATAMYAFGLVGENRLRFMVFGQFLAMLLSALLGCYQLLEGAEDIFRKRFSLNSLLLFTFVLCCVDGVLCLQQQRIPCCAAFSLQVTMSLWSTYQKRSTLLGQMDTMRKATRLDSLGVVEDYKDGSRGVLRGEGQVEDFMESFSTASRLEKTLSVYALVALCISAAIGIAAGVLHGVGTGIQVAAVTSLAAMPASMFLSISRPRAVLEKRLHSLGTVLCGWKGIEGLGGKLLFPVSHSDLFPLGNVKMNGVKFFGSRQPDEIIAYAASLMEADGGSLAPLFTHLLDSRNGRHYDLQDFHAYEDGGIGGQVNGEPVLAGNLSFLKDMGVETPEGIRVNQAVCLAIDGELCGLFAISYEKDKAAVAGLNTLCGYRGLQPVLTTADFILTPGFIRSKFGIKPNKLQLCSHAECKALEEKTLQPDAQALALVTGQGLAPFAYAVTGARAVKSAATAGVAVHMTGGILGIVMMLVLAILGATELLTPANMFLYELVWMIPGLLITEWTRSI